MSSQLMHVHLGLAIFLISAYLFRKYRYRLILAWVSALVPQLLNETLDAQKWIEWTGSVHWTEAIKDTVVTMLWPTVLLYLGWRLFDRERPLD